MITWNRQRHDLPSQKTNQPDVLTDRKPPPRQEKRSGALLRVNVSHHAVSGNVVPFARYSESNSGVTLKSGLQSLKVIENGTIRKLWYGFLFAFHINYGRMFSHFKDIQRQIVA